MNELDKLFPQLEDIGEKIAIHQECLVDNKIAKLSNTYSKSFDVDPGELEEMLIYLKEFMFDVYKIMN